ncbi:MULTISPECIES: alpha/beta hydrolase [Nocardiopsis]|uniref:Alpha/beta hydrolase n=1 Tax=Nocardiopsis sinuspersici TaxID=501010 RepID=A0A1V3BWP9_9ACTN|nr:MULTISPECIES: alpha/beta hydrolase [Nocardiopsis]OOC52823.1 alpha/beta hydrolase [Nocardiopsis sinuspersici]
MRTARVIPMASGVLVTALAASLAAASPAAADPPDSPADDSALAEFHEQELAWAPCTEEVLQGLECAGVEVPLDYSDPDGERVTVAISRARASAPDRRRGILLTNPGGPGGPGRVLGGYYEGTRVGEVYDVIGMDPRGTGASSPRMDCGNDPVPVYPRPTNAEISEATREAIRYQRECQRAQGGLRPHMTTANTARDMDVVRAALDEEKTNYLGYSYGTYLGAVYGSLFPERLDRSVLDSPVHPDGVWREMFLTQAPAYSANMDRYTAWAARHDGALGFGSTQEEVYATFEATSARLREEPREDIPGLVYDSHAFDFEVGQISRYQQFWDLNSDYLGYLVRGEPLPTALASEFEALAEEDEEEDVTLMNVDLQTAVLCEAEWPGRISRYHADAREYREEHPYGVGAYWSVPHPCTFNTLDRPEPPVELERDGYPEPLLIAGEFDANTPYEAGVAMAKRLESPLITVAGDGGHGFYLPGGLECVADPVEAYLVDGVVPDDLTCQGLPPAEMGTQPEPEPDTEHLAPMREEPVLGGPVV